MIISLNNYVECGYIPMPCTAKVMDTTSTSPTVVGTGCIPRLKSRGLALNFSKIKLLEDETVLTTGVYIEALALEKARKDDVVQLDVSHRGSCQRWQVRP